MSNADVEHWDNRYRAPERPPWDTGRVSAELIRRMDQHPIASCRAVEFGCGTGTNAVWLAQRGFEVTAIDISLLAIARAEERARDAGVSVHFLAADVTSLPELGNFDFFFDRGCYHAVRRANVGGFIAQLDRLTADGANGIVLTGNDREEKKPGPPAVSEATLRKELGRLFDFVSLEEFRFDQDEADGARHLGWSCVLRKR